MFLAVCRRAREKPGFSRIRAHAVDANRNGGGEVESDQFHSLADYIAVAAGGELFV